MLGKDRYRVLQDTDLSLDRMRSLAVFYLPLIGPHAFSLYHSFLFEEKSLDYLPLDDLLTRLGMSIDTFEEALGKLNEYKLLSTFKKKDEEGLWIFSLIEPKDRQEFTDDDLFVRDFILKAGGSHYQELLSSLRLQESDLNGFENVTKKYDLRKLETWSEEDESYLNAKKREEASFDTLFDVNYFLKDISDFLFPRRFRTYDNLHEIACIADLYNISYDRMRTYISRLVNRNSDHFDTEELVKMAQASQPAYEKVEEGNYGVPCLSFLMNRQGGREVTPYDKKILYTLHHQYHLSTGVINVLLEHTLKQCDGHLYEKYLYPAAADLHRNGITDAKSAQEFLFGRGGNRSEKDELPVYDASKNPELEEDRLKEILERRKNNG